jgi:hypothetical protein
LLCHDVDTSAAFARARFVYSFARSFVKFLPVVRTGSISLGTGRGFAESTFMPLDFAIVPRRRRSVLVVLCVLSNAILEPRCSSIARTDNPAWQRRCKQPSLKKLERTWFCRKIQGVPEFAPSATRVTGEL